MIVASLFVGVLCWLSITDWRTGRLPDGLVLPALWLGLVLNASGAGFSTATEAIFGAAAGYAALWLISCVYGLVRGGVAFGGGDLKLAAMIGAWLGLTSVPTVLFVAFVSGSCVAAPALAMRRLRLSQRIPFGPALAFGGVLALVAGPTLAGWLTL